MNPIISTMYYFPILLAFAIMTTTVSVFYHFTKRSSHKPSSDSNLIPFSLKKKEKKYFKAPEPFLLLQLWSSILLIIGLFSLGYCKKTRNHLEAILCTVFLLMGTFGLLATRGSVDICTYARIIFSLWFGISSACLLFNAIGSASYASNVAPWCAITVIQMLLTNAHINKRYGSIFKWELRDSKRALWRQKNEFKEPEPFFPPYYAVLCSEIDLEWWYNEYPTLPRDFTPSDIQKANLDAMVLGCQKRWDINNAVNMENYESRKSEEVTKTSEVPFTYFKFIYFPIILVSSFLVIAIIIDIFNFSEAFCITFNFLFIILSSYYLFKNNFGVKPKLSIKKRRVRFQLLEPLWTLYIRRSKQMLQRVLKKLQQTFITLRVYKIPFDDFSL